MITISMMLLPGGSGIGRKGVLHGTIYTTDDGEHHRYSLWGDDESKIYEGSIPKTKSGHRNPIELLHNITKDILDEKD